MNILNIRLSFYLMTVLFFTVVISSCGEKEVQKVEPPAEESNHYNNHGVGFDYPNSWKVYSDMETGFGDITVILDTIDETNIVIKIFPKEKSGDLQALVKTYDMQYDIPVFKEPIPQYEWSDIARSQHKGLRKINDTPNPTVKPFVKEYFRFQLGEQTALVVIESNRNEIEKYGDLIAVLLNTIKLSS